MSKAEFLQGLRNELEGRVPYSVIQENLNYYDSYISKETAGGTPEEAVIEALGGRTDMRLTARERYMTRTADPPAHRGRRMGRGRMDRILSGRRCTGMFIMLT